MTTTSASFSYKDALLSQNDSTRRKDGTRENVDGSGCAGTNRRSGILSVNQDALNGAKIDIHVPFVRQKKRPTKEVQLFDYFSAATTAKKQTAVKPPPAAAAANERPLAKKNLLRGNVLDKDAPELHKGKTREGKKRPTKTKKTVLEGRQVRESEGSTGETEPFSCKYRSYCENASSKELDASVLAFLAEIKRFQDRLWAKDPAKGRIKRRLVCGLRECHKQIGLRDAKCLIVATNIERIPIEGGLDDQIGALCAACREQELPVIFALSKNKLGRVVKKACVSCVAVLNFQGADNQYKTMLEELRKCKEMEQKAEQTTLSEDAPDAEFLDQGIAAISLVPQEDDEEEDDEEEVEDEEETEESSLNRDDPSQQMIASSVAPINPPLYSPYYVDASQFSHYPTAPYIYPYQRPVPYMGSDGAMYFLPYQQYGRPDGYSYLPHPPLPPPPPPYGVSSYPPYDSQPHNAQM